MTMTSSSVVEEHLPDGWQLPAYWYSDPAVFELEKELVFRHNWVLVAMADQLAETGAYVTATLGDVPIVVTRGADGDLHGLVNVCLHRLHPVASGEGCTRLLQCKYHGWTYDLQGRLKTAPRSQNEPGFDRGRMALRTVRVETFGPLVFANADPEAPDLATYLGPAAELVEKLDIDLTGWERAERFEYEVPANWKLFTENALECYHCDLVHRDTFAAAVASGPEDYLCENHDNVLTQTAPVKQAPAEETRDAAELDDFRLLYVWPTSAISVDEYAGVVTQCIPQGPASCRFVVDVYARPGIDPDVMAGWLKMYDETFNEDRSVVTAQQAGYDSATVERGRLMTSNESSIAMFQRRTWRALAHAIEGRSAS